MSKPSPLPFARQEQRLDSLQQLARSQWLGGITHSIGTLENRLNTLARLRRGLCRGQLPGRGTSPWPDRNIAIPCLQIANELKLTNYCKGNQSLSDNLISNLLFHLDLICDYQDRGADRATAVDMALAAFRADWLERCGDLDELSAVFGRLPEDLERHSWESLHNLVDSPAWQAVRSIRRLIDELPELSRLIDSLGRRHPTVEEEASQPNLQPINRELPTVSGKCEERIPELPGELRGIYRADRIARMLPSEAVLLNRPKLRLIWHARRAERALLCYEEDDQASHPEAPLPMPSPGAHEERQPRRQLGPLLVCLDTSGSMQGGAEAVAKAILLEVMRSCGQRKRRCYLIAFSGPGQIVTQELPIDPTGIQTITRFLGHAFHGGTDIVSPLEQSLSLLEEAQWRQADLLIASDGQFGATRSVVQRLNQARQTLGLRVQGILLGDRETVGFLEITDAIFPVREWRRFAHDGRVQSDTPIHSHQLTSLYFPGALRSQENIDATVTPVEAAAAVRRGEKRT